MSVSVDTRQIEKLTQLQATLELLQNPESYTTLLADVKDVLQRYEVASKRYSTTEAADRFLQESKSLLAQAKNEATALREQLVKERKELDQKKAEAVIANDKLVASLKEKQAELQLKEMKLLAMEQQQIKQAQGFDAAVLEQQNYRDKQTIALAEREQVLRTKEEGLKKLLG